MKVTIAALAAAALLGGAGALALTQDPDTVEVTSVSEPAPVTAETTDEPVVQEQAVLEPVAPVEETATVESEPVEEETVAPKPEDNSPAPEKTPVPLAGTGEEGAPPVLAETEPDPVAPEPTPEPEPAVKYEPGPAANSDPAPQPAP